MKLRSIILFLTIVFVQAVQSQIITLDGYYFFEEKALLYVGSVEDAYEPAKLVFNPMDGGGWSLNLYFSDPSLDPASCQILAKPILYPMDKTKVEVSEKKLIFSNDKNEKLELYVDTTSVFGSTSISGYINLEKVGRDYIIAHIYLSDKEADVMNRFYKLVKQISKPYIRKSASCDRSLIGLINNPLGIDWGDSWRTPFDEFLPVAENFYGKYNSSLNYFQNKEYSYDFQTRTRIAKQNFLIDICGQEVNSIDFRDAYLHTDLREDLYDDTKYIKSTEYNIYLHTPKAFKKDPQFTRKEDCIWDKKLALDYCNKVKQELDLLGCSMQKVKSKTICRYEGMKNGKVITLDLTKVNREFFSVSLNIANKTIDYDFYIIWD